MKTRNVFRSLIVLIMLAVSAPTISAAPVVNPVEDSSEQRANQLKDRLEEIRAMDMSKLSKQEKKALRAEVKEIKKEIKAIGGGVYLSVGAIILIVLLIILLA